jgi:hypothetical protein
LLLLLLLSDAAAVAAAALLVGEAEPLVGDVEPDLLGFFLGTVFAAALAFAPLLIPPGFLSLTTLSRTSLFFFNKSSFAFLAASSVCFLDSWAF